MKQLIQFMVVVVIFAFISTTSFAQTPKVEKWENAKWYQMVMLKYKAEKIQVANAFVEKYFVPVDKEIGRKVLGFHSPFGDWDEIVFFPLAGVEELNYKISPNGEKWFMTFVKQQGGLENANKLLAEW